MAKFKGDKKYENYSSERLEELLQKDSLCEESPQGGGENFGANELMQIAGILSERRFGGEGEALTERALDSFRKDYLPMLDEENEYDDIPKAEASPAAHRKTAAKKRWEKVLIAALSTLCFLAAMIMVGYAAGYDVLEDFFDLPVNPPRAESFSSSMSTDLQLYLNERSAQALLLPKTLPEGFLLTRSYCDQGDIAIYAFYTDDERTLAVVIAEGNKSAEKEENARPFTANGITHYLTSTGGKCSAAWNSSGYSVTITGDVTDEEMMQMILSAYE
ncbi:MAG: DUF4367 domain-containing protein [Eubacteriaceae bacterium]|nr:DUF4367 domain-containing protein [Eubacteriaceae bacterium]